jgi:hypothetical protein
MHEIIEMRVGFTHQGDWFVFDGDTGATLNRGFRTKMQATNWIGRKLREAA